MKFLSRTYRQYPLHLTLGLLCTLVLFLNFFARSPLRTDRRADAVLPRAATALSPVQAREAYGRMELSFEANQGQTDKSVNFLTRGTGYTLFLKPAEAVFGLRNSDCGSRNEDAARLTLNPGDTRSETNPQTAICNLQSEVLRLKLVGSDPRARVEGLERLRTTVNYFVGNDPAKWHANLSTFRRVRYSEIYPGIDVVYYGNQRQLEYDFVVSPGRDPRVIKLQFAGADKVTGNAAGDLLLTIGENTIHQPKPVVYQEVGGARRTVAGSYKVEPDGQVGFALGEYDTQLPLVIDPTLVYSSYLGGGGTDEARDIAVDSSGNAYLCGNTSSVNFPSGQPVPGHVRRRQLLRRARCLCHKDQCGGHRADLFHLPGRWR